MLFISQGLPPRACIHYSTAHIIKSFTKISSTDRFDDGEAAGSKTRNPGAVLANPARMCTSGIGGFRSRTHHPRLRRAPGDQPRILETWPSKTTSLRPLWAIRRRKLGNSDNVFYGGRRAQSPGSGRQDSCARDLG